MWSTAVCIYEMFTGQVLFTGDSNNDMIRLFQESLGKILRKMVTAHVFPRKDPTACTEDGLSQGFVQGFVHGRRLLCRMRFVLALQFCARSICWTREPHYAPPAGMPSSRRSVKGRMHFSAYEGLRG